ncbi:hypothetical protein Pmani_016835 [Petrolisthes manimaculis]|uniref:ETS domain-containing protein n=1 Tax=Petrolisthes manimaculis TaxID=1843537 RepID=A0AAE1U611_9EUCA|nr:hypothetical protein Pmani_016835 [Petrolisthes manimaculis]
MTYLVGETYAAALLPRLRLLQSGGFTNQPNSGRRQTNPATHYLPETLPQESDSFYFYNDMMTTEGEVEGGGVPTLTVETPLCSSVAFDGLGGSMEELRALGMSQQELLTPTYGLATSPFTINTNNNNSFLSPSSPFDHHHLDTSSSSSPVHGGLSSSSSPLHPFNPASPFSLGDLDENFQVLGLREQFGPIKIEEPEMLQEDERQQEEDEFDDEEEEEEGGAVGGRRVKVEKEELEGEEEGVEVQEGEMNWLEGIQQSDMLKKIPSSTRRRERGPKSWEFLMRLLADPRSNPALVKFENEADGTFRLVKPSLVAQLWSSRPGLVRNTSYNNFARGLRHHYNTDALQPVMEKQLVYRCGPRALAYLNELKHRHNTQN